MAEVRTVSMKWILIGAAVISGIHFILHPGFAMEIGGFVRDTLNPGPEAEVYVYRGIIAVFSFFFGGLIIGWMSPGETLKEPAIAGVLAACVNNIRNYIFWPDDFNVLAALVALGVGFGTAMAGAWVGEKIQGDTTDKMRERGELPPTG
jgi:hypothetical protein